MGHVEKGSTPRDAFDFKSGLDAFNLGKMHAHFSTLEYYLASANKVPEGPEKKALMKLGLLCGLQWIKENAALIVEADTLNAKHFSFIDEIFEELLDDIEKDALA